MGPTLLHPVPGSCFPVSVFWGPWNCMTLCRKLPRKIIYKKKTTKTDVDSISYQLSDLLRKLRTRSSQGAGSQAEVQMESAGIQAKLFLPDSSLVSAGKLPASGSGDGGLWGRVTRPGVRPAPEMGASLPDWQCSPAARAQSLPFSSQPRRRGRDAARCHHILFLVK